MYHAAAETLGELIKSQQEITSDSTNPALACHFGLADSENEFASTNIFLEISCILLLK
jgi:hypothetical protein